MIEKEEFSYVLSFPSSKNLKVLHWFLTLK